MWWSGPGVDDRLCVGVAAVDNALSCCGVAGVTGGRTLVRCMDFCRWGPESREVEETPWVAS